MLKYFALLLFLTGCAGRPPVAPPVTPPPPIEPPASEIVQWNYEGDYPGITNEMISDAFGKALARVNTVRPTDPRYDEAFFAEITRIAFRPTAGISPSGFPYLVTADGRKAYGNFDPFQFPWLLEVPGEYLAALEHELEHEIGFIVWQGERCSMDDPATPNIDERTVYVYTEIDHGGLCDPLRH